MRNIEDNSERVKDHDAALNRQRNRLSELDNSRDHIAVEIGKLKCDIEKLKIPNVVIGQARREFFPQATQKNLDFYTAMRLLSEGKSICRTDWVSKGHYKLSEHQGCMMCMFYIGTYANDPARITAEEINATDWEIYNG